tara:strand:- start:91 stop:396 length:306 start_codon:yes stop_codon:yes gene_type:complete
MKKTNLDKILNEALNKALIGRNKIKQVNSNEIADFVNKHLAAINYTHSSLQLPSREDVIIELTTQEGYLYGDEEYIDRRNYINGFTDAYRYIKQFVEEKQD